MTAATPTTASHCTSRWSACQTTTRPTTIPIPPAIAAVLRWLPAQSRTYRFQTQRAPTATTSPTPIRITDDCAAPTVATAVPPTATTGAASAGQDGRPRSVGSPGGVLAGSGTGSEGSTSATADPDP